MPKLGLRTRSTYAAAVGALLLIASCGSSSGDEESSADTDPTESTQSETSVGTAEAADEPANEADGDSSDADADAEPGTLGGDLRALVDGFGETVNPELVAAATSHGEHSAGWLLTDMLRFYRPGSSQSAVLVEGIRDLGIEFDEAEPWKTSINTLIANDTPAPPGYDQLKVDLLTLIDARWEPLLSGPNDIDFRILGWGGVFIDDRPLGEAAPCFGRGCIPALDFPGVTDAAGGDWYGDDKIVFGIVVNGEARAYQQNIMQIHEMVNDVVGGRRIGMPYCTLCGSAQAYLTDAIIDESGVETTLDTPLVLRTSGLLSRSNKVMYELTSQSVFDTFTGDAVSGSWFEAGTTLTQITVQVATWGDWKAAHPDTTIIAPDGGIGRVYVEDPLQGRDDNGPIFPVGDVDPRLSVQHPVVAAVAPDGTPVAFDATEAREVLAAGEPVEFSGLEVRTNGAGLVIFADGVELATHESFWFAWSQFWPDTVLWTGN